MDLEHEDVSFYLICGIFVLCDQLTGMIFDMYEYSRILLSFLNFQPV